MDSASSNYEKHIAADLTPIDHRKHYEAPRPETLGTRNGFTQTSIIIGVE